jgi:hypothetical protein
VLDPFHRTVRLPWTKITGCFIKVDDLAATFTGLDPEWFLSFGAGYDLT